MASISLPQWWGWFLLMNQCVKSSARPQYAFSAPPSTLPSSRRGARRDGNGGNALVIGISKRVAAAAAEAIDATCESEEEAALASIRVAGDPLSLETILEFERNGHVATRGLFAPSELGALDERVRGVFGVREAEAWVHSARVMLGDDAVYDSFGEPMLETSEECREALASYGVELPFLQVFNSWQRDEAVKALATCPRLAAVASQLLGVPRVRLYQDSMFLKRPGDGETRWHSDLHMAPFDSNAMVTCWIPLDPVPAQEDGGTGLTFASGSHRDFALAFWSRPHEAGTDFSDRYLECMVDHGALRVGDATWHHGWTLHAAPPNRDPEEDEDGDEEDDEEDDEEGWLGEEDAAAALLGQGVVLVGGGSGGAGGAGGGKVRPAPKSRLAFTVSFIADGARIQGKRPESDEDEDGEDEDEGVIWMVNDDEAEEEEANMPLLGDGDEDFHPKAEVDAAMPKKYAPVVRMDEEDRSSYEGWLNDIAPGAVADHPLLPLVWDQGSVTL